MDGQADKPRSCPCQCHCQGVTRLELLSVNVNGHLGLQPFVLPEVQHRLLSLSPSPDTWDIFKALPPKIPKIHLPFT